MASTIQFGVYELDREAAELRKHGVLIRLQEQPLQVLMALVERPGEIVTREELQERIWGKNTFVDFEQSLNKAVNRLREALCDDAAQPRYIETIPRRGYRFVAPVTGIPRTEANALTQLVGAALAGGATKFHSHRRSWIAASIASCVPVVTGVWIIAWWKKSDNPVLQETRLMTSAGFAPALSRDGKLLAYGVSVVNSRRADGCKSA